MDFLRYNLNPESVCTILDLSLFFDEITLTKWCLDFIGLNWELICQQEDFLSLSSAAVSKIVEYDNLCLDSEATLYEACVQWAKHQIRKSRAADHHPDESEPCDDEIRQTLGDIIHRIRFPNMDAFEFACVVGKRRVLSRKEKLELYHHFLTRGELPNDHSGRLRFDRGPRSRICSRFSEPGYSEATWPCGGCMTDSISFTTDFDVEMLGVILYGAEMKAVHDVNIEVIRVDNNENFCERLTRTIGYKLASDGTDDTKNAIYFQNSAVVKANQLYTISVAMEGPLTYSGIGGERTVSCDGVTFRFYSSNRSTNGTSEQIGQIPHIIFRRI